MNTIVKSSHGITLVPVTSKLLAERLVVLRTSEPTVCAKFKKSESADGARFLVGF